MRRYWSRWHGRMPGKALERGPTRTILRATSAPATSWRSRRSSQGMRMCASGACFAVRRLSRTHQRSHRRIIMRRSIIERGALRRSIEHRLNWKGFVAARQSLATGSNGCTGKIACPASARRCHAKVNRAACRSGGQPSCAGPDQRLKSTT